MSPEPRAGDGRDGERPRRKRGVGAFWSGTISFGLISVPVQLFPASRRSAISLRMLDRDGTPLRRRYYCPEHDRIVSGDEIVKGHEVGEGEHVVVTDEELEAVLPGKSREIDLQRFVDVSRIPPLLFERAYFLTPAGDSNKAYRLLVEVMEDTGKAGIATFVMRGKEYLVAILAEDGILRAETLRFDDEVRRPEEVGLRDDPVVDEDEVARFESAIREHVADEIDPAELEDEAGAALRELASRKWRQNRDVVEAPSSGNGEDGGGDDPDEETGEVDLLETIRLSLRGEDGDAGEGARRDARAS